MSSLIVLLLCLPPSLLAIALLISGYRRKVSERKGCEQLLALVKATEDEQKQAIETFLNKSLHYDSSASKGKAEELLKMRKQFMRKLLLGFLHRDVLTVAALDNELSQLTNAYHKLDAKSVAAPAPKNDATDPQTQQLHSENQRLRHEIHITLSTLNNIFAEYSSMFGNEDGDRNLSVSQIVDRMQQLSGAGGDAQLEQAAQRDQAALPSELEATPEVNVASAVEADMLGDIVAESAALLDSSDNDPSWDEAFAEAAKQNES